MRWDSVEAFIEGLGLMVSSGYCNSGSPIMMFWFWMGSGLGVSGLRTGREICRKRLCGFAAYSCKLHALRRDCIDDIVA